MHCNENHHKESFFWKHTWTWTIWSYFENVTLLLWKKQKNIYFEMIVCFYFGVWIAPYIFHEKQVWTTAAFLRVLVLQLLLSIVSILALVPLKTNCHTFTFHTITYLYFEVFQYFNSSDWPNWLTDQWTDTLSYRDARMQWQQHLESMTNIEKWEISTGSLERTELYETRSLMLQTSGIL